MKYRFLNPWLFVLMLVTPGLFAGCAVKFVQSYDEKLETDTEAIFKKASIMIEDGIKESPSTDGERADIVSPKSHPAGAAKFEDRYRGLEIDADALILRALAKSPGVGSVGDTLQRKIESLINEALPSQCADLEQRLGVSTSSLTVKNYVDLKCLFIKWQAQHEDSVFTKGTLILKRTNWELRKSTVFSAILAIQKAEASKKH